MTGTTTNVIALGTTRVEYVVRRSPSAKRVRIRVGPSGVFVTVPKLSPDSRANAFLRENASWVLEQLRFVERAGSFRGTGHDMPRVSLRGRPVSVQVREGGGASRYPKVTILGDVINIDVPRTGNRDASGALERWLRRLARSEICSRIDQRAREMRRRPSRLFVMGQRTKWGNCSRRRNISINWRLIMAPPEVLDYVIVHELAHLIEPYHSHRFWLVVASHCPDCARHRQWLKENGDALAAMSLIPAKRPFVPSSSG